MTLSNKRSRLLRLQWLVRWNHYRMLVRPSINAWERHKRLVVALGDAEALAGPYITKDGVYKCPDCGEQDGRPLTRQNMAELCYWCDKLRSTTDLKSA